MAESQSTLQQPSKQFFTIQSADFYKYPVNLQHEILETENKILRKNADYSALEQLVDAHPDIPEFKGLLCILYDNLGLREKSEVLARQIIHDHPGYIAARIFVGIQCVFQDKQEEAFQLFDGFKELRDLFPERDGFLPTEEEDYLFMGILYFSSIKNLPPAVMRLDALRTRNPEHPLLLMAELMVDHSRINRNKRLFHEWDKKRRSVIYVDRSLPQTKDFPAFENTEVGLFYHKDLTFDRWEINQFLNLPRASFLRDLDSVIQDARQRYLHLFYEDGDEIFPDLENVSFLMHAVLFLTECKAEDRLPLILGMLEEDELFFFDYFDDYLRDCLMPAIYTLGNQQLEELKKFMLEPNLALNPRDVVADAVSIIAIHQPERRAEVIRWFDEVFQYFIIHRNDDNIIDTDLIGSMVIYCIRINAIELLETISTLFGFDLVSIDFCGPLEDVTIALSSMQEVTDDEAILTIFEQYEKFSIAGHDDEFGSYSNLLQENEFDDPDETMRDTLQMPVKSVKTPGRNDPCPCGSGKKYKKCCMPK